LDDSACNDVPNPGLNSRPKPRPPQPQLSIQARLEPKAHGDSGPLPTISDHDPPSASCPRHLRAPSSCDPPPRPSESTPPSPRSEISLSSPGLST
jgi:hypothetical protein